MEEEVKTNGKREVGLQFGVECVAQSGAIRQNKLELVGAESFHQKV